MVIVKCTVGVSGFGFRTRGRSRGWGIGGSRIANRGRGRQIPSDEQSGPGRHHSLANPGGGLLIMEGDFCILEEWDW